jgi:hypothetical protein
VPSFLATTKELRPMPKTAQTPQEKLAAAARATLDAKAMEMRVRRRYMKLYGVNPPKGKHKKTISIERLVNLAPEKRTRTANGTLASKRGRKPKEITVHYVKKSMPKKLRTNFVESKSAFRQSQAGYRDTDKRAQLEGKRERRKNQGKDEET